MKKIPHTLAGKVCGFVFFALMIFGGFLGNTTPVFAQQVSLQTSGDAPQLDSATGKYTWKIHVNGQNVPAGSPINVIIKQSGTAFANTTVTLPPPPQIQTAEYVASNLNPGSNYSVFAEYNANVSNVTSITTPTSQQTGNTQNQTTPPIPSSDGGIPKCWLGLTEGVSVAGCAAQIVYYIIFVPTSFILALSGQFMDFLLAYTLDSSSYSMGNFVGQGWKLVRDLTNILFIFILVSIGIGTIIGNAKLGDKKLIGWVIIVALLINFSLFFTKVLIDAGNILGTVFYSAMGVKASDTTSAITNNDLFASSNKKAISVGIVSKFNPQTIFNETNSLSINVPDPAGVGTPTDTGTPPGWFMMISLILSVINIVTAYAFFVVGLLFVGRVVGLWMAMILSPLAFMSLAVPSYMGFIFSEYKFGSWAEKVAKLSFSAPVFLFFLYVILSFLNQGFLTQAISVSSNMTTIEKFISILVPFVIITMLILKAKDVTVKMSDEIGKKFASWGESLGSLAVGGALAIGTGGAALAMRGTVGRGAMALSRSQTLQNAKSKTGLTGLAARLTLRGTDKLSKATFDARNTAAADALKKSPLGFDLKKNALGNAFLGTDDKNRGLFGSTSGGLEGMNKRREADIVKEAEERQLKGLAFENQNTRAKEYKESKEKAIADQTSLNAAAEATVPKATYESDRNRKIAADIARGVISSKDEFNEEAYKETYFGSVGYKSIDSVTNKIKEDWEKKYGDRSTLSGTEYNADVVKEFKQEVEKGNYGVGGVIKKSIENKTGVDLNQKLIPGYEKAGIVGAAATMGGTPVVAPLVGAVAIARGVGGFEKNERTSALKAIDKKFNNKDLESVTSELKKIDDDIKKFLIASGLNEDAIKNLTDFEKGNSLTAIRKEKEKELSEKKFERDSLHEQFKRETDATKKATLKNKILDLDAEQSNLRDEIDDLKNLFTRKEKKTEQKEKIENKMNPKDDKK